MNQAIPAPESLIFRRQFVFSPQPLADPLFGEWGKFGAGGGFFTVHPDCEATLLEKDDFSYVLFGYILDPSDPKADNDAVLRKLHAGNPWKGGLSGFCNATNPYGGRWVLFAISQKNAVVLHDATGLKQVFYGRKEEVCLISSSDALLARVMGAEADPHMIKQFTDAYPDQAGIWWPGDTTAFRGIRCLLPDHALDLAAGRVFRYWPGSVLRETGVTEAFDHIYGLLSGSVAAMAGRQALSLALTGGNDSRLLLALLRNEGSPFTTYTVFVNGEYAGDADYRVPLALSRQYRFDYHPVIETDGPPDWFAKIYREHSTLHRPVFLDMAWALLRHRDPSLMSVQAVVNEIGRTKYEYKPYRLNARDLSNLTFMGENPFVVEAYDTWLREARQGVAGSPVRIEDLFYHEQRMGRWNAMNRTEWDIAQDVFEPFNCRELIGHILLLPRREKKRHDNRLYQYLFAALDQDFSAVPVCKAAGTYRPLRRVRDLLTAVRRSVFYP